MDKIFVDSNSDVLCIWVPTHKTDEQSGSLGNANETFAN